MPDEPQPWTDSELATQLNNATMTLYSNGRVLIDYCQGIDPVLDGPVIVTPQTIDDFIEQVKRTIVYMLREVADTIEGRPMPRRVNPPMPPAPEPG